jgi:hypothetical protein
MADLGQAMPAWRVVSHKNIRLSMVQFGIRLTDELPVVVYKEVTTITS